MKIKTLDLFAGIGGMRIASEKAAKSLKLQHECVMACEIDKYASQTYIKNFPNTYMTQDIEYFDTKKKIKEFIPNHDLLLAGFPCQPFSRAGLKKGFKDTRGTLFHYIAEILKYKKPKSFILENVRGLKEHDKGKTLKIILSVLSKDYYVPEPQILNAKDFGLPQNRARIFIVGIRKNLKKNYEYKFPLGSKKITQIKDILEKRVNKSFQISEKLWDSHQKRKEKNLRNGKGFGFSLFTGNDKHTRTLSARYNKDGSEILIKTNQLPRKLTPRECANLQGFPKSFKIISSNAQSYKQFGNSVPVNVVNKICYNLLSYLYFDKR